MDGVVGFVRRGVSGCLRSFGLPTSQMVSPKDKSMAEKLASYHGAEYVCYGKEIVCINGERIRSKQAPWLAIDERQFRRWVTDQPN
jgi:hypothetical protein